MLVKIILRAGFARWQGFLLPRMGLFSKKMLKALTPSSAMRCQSPDKYLSKPGPRRRIDTFRLTQLLFHSDNNLATAAVAAATTDPYASLRAPLRAGGTTRHSSGSAP
jgi:hypothetical protein